MTLREWAENYCEQRSMWPDQAKRVIDEVAADEASESLKNRWAEQIEGYPVAVMACLMLDINRHALAFIERECPVAWFKSRFED